MSSGREDILGQKLRRSDFLKLGAVTAGSGVLAACGGGDDGGGNTTAAQPAEERPSIDQEPGNLEVFE